MAWGYSALGCKVELLHAKVLQLEASALLPMIQIPQLPFLSLLLPSKKARTMSTSYQVLQ